MHAATNQHEQTERIQRAIGALDVARTNLAEAEEEFRSACAAVLEDKAPRKKAREAQRAAAPPKPKKPAAAKPAGTTGRHWSWSPAAKARAAKKRAAAKRSSSKEED